MDKLDLILWVLSGGFALTFGMLVLLWNHLNVCSERLELKIDKLDGKVNELDKRLIAIETTMRFKECCMLKDDSQMRKAE